MTAGMRAALAAAAVAGSLAVAGSALAANTATIAVSTAGTATTVHISVPQATDPIAAITIYVPTGYTMNLSAAANTGIGTEVATAFAHDAGLTLPLTGTVTTANPVAPATDACSPGTHGAIWYQNLSVAGQSLIVPIYVDPTAGAATALGAYQMLICLPPWDVPVGTPGRSFDGAQLLDAKFTVNGIFTAPTSGLAVWHTLFTPYTPGTGKPNLVGTFEARALAGAPSLTLKAAKKKTGYVVTGKLSEGGLPVGGTTVVLKRGATATKLSKAGSATTGATGAWSVSGKLAGKKAVYFKASATVGERDATATGCAQPLPATVAPAGCASATLSAWTVSSPAAKLKP
jgi:hypothetical protein